MPQPTSLLAKQMTRNILTTCSAYARPFKINRFTPEYLRSRFDYNRDTGDLVYKPREGKRFRGWNGAWAGKIAGTVKNGYVYVKLNGTDLLAHHVAWVITYGPITHLLDHRDRRGTNNAIANIRQADRFRNMWNRNLLARNRTGVCGVAWRESRQRYVAYISAFGKSFHIGYYLTLAEAIAARLHYQELLHGEYAAVR